MTFLPGVWAHGLPEDSTSCSGATLLSLQLPPGKRANPQVGWAACRQHKVTMDVPDPLLGQGVGRSAALPCAGSSVGGSQVVCKVNQ